MDHAIVDANVMFAAIQSRDADHQACRDLLTRGDHVLIVPALCVAEVAHLAGRDLGAHIEAGFVRSLRQIQVESPSPADWERIAELIEQYADFPLGAVDASVVALAERLNVRTIFTLDRRHFAAVRPAHVEAFELLP